jgi:GT2 family glycosyltransferase
MKLQVQTVVFNNRAESVLKAMRSLAASFRYAELFSHNLEVIVRIGDSSASPVLSSEVLSLIQSAFDNMNVTVHYEVFGANLGSAAGHNHLFDVGVYTFDPDALLIMNPDVYASPNAISEMLDELSADDVAAVEARQVPLQHPKYWDNTTGTTGWVTTAFTFIKRHIFEGLGKFDSDNFFLYCDDVDFSWRARLAGYRVVFAPQASVFHDKRLSAAGLYIPSGAERYFAIEAAMMMAWKYCNDSRFQKLITEGLSSDDSLWQRAAKSANEKIAARSEGDRLDRDHKVAEFYGDDYARHVFRYGE